MLFSSEWMSYVLHLRSFRQDQKDELLGVGIAALSFLLTVVVRFGYFLVNTVVKAFLFSELLLQKTFIIQC